MLLDSSWKHTDQWILKEEHKNVGLRICKNIFLLNEESD